MFGYPKVLDLGSGSSPMLGYRFMPLAHMGIRVVPI